MNESRRPWKMWIYGILFLIPCFYVVQATMVNDSTYVDLHNWAHGTAKLPYQHRDLIAPVLRLAEKSPVLIRQAAAHNGLGIFADAMNYPLFLINWVSLYLCGVLATALYRIASKGRLWWLPASVLLVFFIVSVSLRWEHRYLFPYDLLSMFFFTLGLFLIYRGWLWPLLLLMPLATANRETTIMWIPLLLLGAVDQYRTNSLPRRRLLEILSITALLCILWLITVHHMAAPYIHNDASETYPRLWSNLRAIRTWKGIVETGSAFAFSGFFLFAYRRRIADTSLRAYMLILPLWFTILFYQGEIVESRVFAELFPFAAVAATLIFEATYLSEEGKPCPTQGSNLLF